MEQPVRVRILEHEYLIKSDEDEDRVHEIAKFVNNKLLDIMNNSTGLSERKIAILAAFHIANDYFQLLKERGDMVTDIQKRALLLNNQIDSIVR